MYLLHCVFPTKVESPSITMCLTLFILSHLPSPRSLSLCWPLTHCLCLWGFVCQSCLFVAFGFISHTWVKSYGSHNSLLDIFVSGVVSLQTLLCLAVKGILLKRIVIWSWLVSPALSPVKLLFHAPLLSSHAPGALHILFPMSGIPSHSLPPPPSAANSSERPLRLSNSSLSSYKLFEGRNHELLIIASHALRILPRIE